MRAARLWVLLLLITGCQTSIGEQSTQTTNTSTGSDGETIRLSDNTRDALDYYLRTAVKGAFVAAGYGSAGFIRHCVNNKKCEKSNSELAEGLVADCKAKKKYKDSCQLIAVGKEIVWQGSIQNAPDRLIAQDDTQSRFKPLAIPKDWQPLERKLESYAPGTVVSGKFFEFDGHRIPLPEGQWQIIARDKRTVRWAKQNIDLHLIHEVLLADIRNNKVNNVIYFDSKVASLLPIYKYNLYKYCSNKSNHVSKIFVNNTKNQECYYVSVGRIFVKNGKRIWQLGKSYLEEQGVEVPSWTSGSSYRFAIKNDWLNIQFHRNLETEGFTLSDNVVRTLLAWLKSTVKDDERKSAYIAKIAEWSKEWHQKFKAAFGRPVPGASI
ncbi:MAG: hypothetical protein CMM48_12035 [Rhodospirillaceae bacterium]|nr:hypothetical protein [Rhodospirillaceae bacterium]MBL24615.1 hypothetical protein [Rhodospirillaceae bacterium]